MNITEDIQTNKDFSPVDFYLLRYVENLLQACLLSIVR